MVTGTKDASVVVGLGVETLSSVVLDVTGEAGFGSILPRSRVILGDARAPEPPGGEASAAD